MAKKITNTDPSKGETVFNCNPNLTHYAIPVHDPLWFEFRTIGAMGYSGLSGASECYKFMQIEAEKYSPVLPEILEEKAGLRQPNRKITPAMVAGIMLEPTILNMWQYYDGTKDGYCQNIMNKDKKRNYKSVNAYIVNSNFEWLFVSLDASIPAGMPTLTGYTLDSDSPLEIKTIGFQAANSYSHGIPKSHVIQVQTQMLVTETDYCEMAILEAGRDLRVEPFESNTDIQEAMLEKTHYYWGILLQLKELKQERDSYIFKGLKSKADHINDVIQNLLPLPISGDAYSEYYTSKFEDVDSSVADDDFMAGTTVMFKKAKKRSELVYMKELYLEKINEFDNYFRHVFVTNKTNAIDFGKNGKIKFTKKSNGKNYFPSYTSFKENINEVALKTVFNKHLDDIMNNDRTK